MPELKRPGDQPPDKPPDTPPIPAADQRWLARFATPEPSDKPTDRPRLNADGSWEWKGRHLTPEANEVANRTLARLRGAEPHLTATMKSIERQLPAATLEGLEHRLKSPDRFKERLAKWVGKAPDTPVTTQSTKIYDGIRYTFVIESDRYTQGVRDVFKKFADSGYESVLIRNAWRDPDYRGINTRWRNPESGYLFEVQFHTPQSFEAKQRTHDAYEKIMDRRTPAEEKLRLEQYQRDVTAAVETPPGAPGIRRNRRKG